MRIIFDNNIWISFLIGKRLASLRPAFFRKDIELYYCDELEREFLDVAHRPKIQKYIDEEQVERVHRLMTDFCLCGVCHPKATAPVRDPKDVYLLSLSESVQADYLVSGDTDLTDLCYYQNTRIIDFNEALIIIEGRQKQCRTLNTN